jgi:hypothetical protein
MRIKDFEGAKKVCGVEIANCHTCMYQGSDDDGAEMCPVSWPICNKFPRYENLKSFPFKKEMSCWEPDFWRLPDGMFPIDVGADGDAERAFDDAIEKFMKALEPFIELTAPTKDANAA